MNRTLIGFACGIAMTIGLGLTTAQDAGSKPQDDEMADQMRLILGLIFVRYLNEPDRARPLLDAAAKRLGDSARRQMAIDLLREIGD